MSPTQGQTDTRSHPFSTTAVNNIASYQTPMLAVHNGMPARIVATGDREGSSPVCQIVDTDGVLEWVALKELRIIDPNFLPPDLSTLANALNRVQK
jgi:hypothetical protein